MSDVEYTQAFWNRANELSRKIPCCEKCGALPTRARKSTKDKPGTREVRVRVTLHGSVPLPSRLHLECTSCHPDPVVRKTPKKDLLAQILPLPFEGNTPNVK
jgi:hypothetical protein